MGARGHDRVRPSTARHHPARPAPPRERRGGRGRGRGGRAWGGRGGWGVRDVCVQRRRGAGGPRARRDAGCAGGPQQSQARRCSAGPQATRHRPWRALSLSLSHSFALRLLLLDSHALSLSFPLPPPPFPLVQHGLTHARSRISPSFPAAAGAWSRLVTRAHASAGATRLCPAGKRPTLRGPAPTPEKS